MKALHVILFCLITLSVFAQSNSWERESKNSVYLECISKIEDEHTFPKAQKENICLCYMQHTMDKYSNDEYENKISVERERLLSNGISNCMDDLGLEVKEEKKTALVVNEKPKTDNYNKYKGMLIGTWSFEKGTFTFYQDKEYKYQKRSSKCRGKWHLVGDFLQIDSKFCTDESFELVKVTADEIVMYRKRGRKLFHLRRQQ